MAFDLAFDLHGQIEGQNTDIVPKLRQCVFQKVLKRRLACLVFNMTLKIKMNVIFVLSVLILVLGRSLNEI